MFLSAYDDFDFKPIGSGNFRLQGDLFYQDAALGQIHVVDGFISDLASYGYVSGSFFSKVGKSMRPAFLHDMGYREQPEGISRATWDRVYREALILEGTSSASAWSQWAGLRVGGWRAWNANRKQLLDKRG